MMASIPILTKLVDAQAMHREYPETFDAPDAQELAAIKPGDWVKICREGGSGARWSAPRAST